MPAFEFVTGNAYPLEGQAVFAKRSNQITVTILNNPCYVQLMTRLADPKMPGVIRPNWDTSEERRMIPGVWGIDPNDVGGAELWGVRLRSAVKDKPAIVEVAG